MKKTLVILMCCIAVLFAACKKKSEEPTPDGGNYSEQYVGSYAGSLTIAVVGTIDTVNVTAPMTFPVDSVWMEIKKGGTENSLKATVTIDNETQETTGVATAEKASFEKVHLTLNKPDFNIVSDIKLNVSPAENDSLNVGGDFSGSGTANFFGSVYPIVSTGTVSGKLAKQ